MKIVINAFSARVGGGRTYLTNLLGNLPQDPDLEVHLFAQPDLPFPADPRIKRVATGWPVVNPLARALWERFALPAYLRREQANLLFCPGGVVGTAPPPGCSVVTMFRNMMPFDRAATSRAGWGIQRLRNWMLRRVMLKSMSEADLTIFVSDHARRLIEAETRIPNAVTIPHGIARAFRTADLELPRPPAAGEGDYVLYVSRFEVYKHHHEIVQAYALLPEELRGAVRLLLAGEMNSGEAERARRLVRPLGLEERVIFVGAVPYGQLPAFYRNAKVILFASSCENCPNILLEAFGAGRPLLSSDVMPMPEFGGPGIGYFSPFDPEDISRALEQALSDPEYARRLGTASAERGRTYDWERTAQATWAALKRAARS